MKGESQTACLNAQLKYSAKFTGGTIAQFEMFFEVLDASHNTNWTLTSKHLLLIHHNSQLEFIQIALKNNQHHWQRDSLLLWNTAVCDRGRCDRA